MRLDNDRLRQALAAEYVLGTLPPRARRRFQWHLRRDPGLRRLVGQWERRLTPLADGLPPLAPPRRVWSAIEQRLFGAPRARVWRSVAFWRLAAAAAGVAAIALAVWLAPPEDIAPPERMVTVMTDIQTQSPAMTVSWDAGRPGQRLLRIRVIGHAEMAPDTAWELWMLPGGDKPPVSLGLVSTHETQTLTVPRELAARLDQAWGLAMSVEPRGGSPTGLPTGPVLYKGQCVRI
ncbi:MAG TPA: anti-sigma factor [Burkholderiales bacterium]|jgi:anti-sigma-K factor RskA|nr:anti-sigma factor [Burkholderiales bacterium]